MPDRYFLSFGEDAIARHYDVTRERELSGALFAMDLQHVPEGAYMEVTVTCADRPGLLALITGAMAAERLDILAARIFTRASGPQNDAVDVFYIRDRNGNGLRTAPVWRRIEKNLGALLRGETTAEALMARSERAALLDRAVPRVDTRVEIDNVSSSSYSIVDVLTQDRVGVLYLITKTLFELGLTIGLSKIATEANRVIDAFYVREVCGGKVTDPARVTEIRTRLRDALLRAQGQSAPAPQRGEARGGDDERPSIAPGGIDQAIVAPALAGPAKKETEPT